jgi:hypothetical protein
MSHRLAILSFVMTFRKYRSEGIYGAACCQDTSVYLRTSDANIHTFRDYGIVRFR